MNATRFDELANLPLKENRPTHETARTLRDELLFQRATQTYLWALPLINTLGMKFGSDKVFGAGYNVLPVWKKRLDAKTLVATPNSDVIYAMSYVDLGKNGPLVFSSAPELRGHPARFLAELVDSEGANLADLDWFGMMAAIGIVCANRSHLIRRQRRESSIGPRRPSRQNEPRCRL